MDKLQEMFSKQKVLQIKLGMYPFENFKAKQEFINLNTLAAIDELMEAIRETSWKNPAYIKGGWKKTQSFNNEKFKEEIIDIWHFLINLTIAARMDEKELVKRFINKNLENSNRKDRGY